MYNVYYFYVQRASISNLWTNQPMNIGKDLVAASATPLILSILSEGKSYGYAIIKRVAELSGGELQWTDGMLYPVLHRLERNGFVKAIWGRSESGRQRKYYLLTDSGAEELASQRRQWQMVDSALRRMLFRSLQLAHQGG
jgi:PadR family transcriptional regulator PadR